MDAGDGGGRGTRRLPAAFRGARRGAARATPGTLPRGLVLAGAWSWRLLAIGAALAVLVFLVIQLRLIVIPVFVAVLLAALLVPVVDGLERHRWPRWLAITATLAAVLVVVGGLVVLIVWQVRQGSDALRAQSIEAYTGFKDWLIHGPLGFTEDQLEAYVGRIGTALQQDSDLLVNGAVSFGSSLGHFLAGFLLAMFATIFILVDGKGIWSWIVRIFPRRARAAVDGAGHTGWRTLVNFARMQVFVAFIDAVGIGIGAAVLQLPLAVPIAVLVFLGSFVPVVGAIATGALAVFVALVYQGWVFALIMLGIVLLVQQVESHLLQPLIMGTAVKVHPLAVVLAVAAGTFLAGIPGALFAVPTVAVLNVMVRYVAGGSWRPGAGPPDSAGIWRTVERRPRS